VLKRYDWNLPPDQTRKDGASMDALVGKAFRAAHHA
jgi:hypothetical protein